MHRAVIHDQHAIAWSAVRQNAALYPCIEDLLGYTALVDECSRKESISGVGWQYTPTLTPLERSTLHGSYAYRRVAVLPIASAAVGSRFVNADNPAWLPKGGNSSLV